MNKSKSLAARTRTFVGSGTAVLALCVASAVVVHGLGVENAQAESLLAESRAELSQSHQAAATLALSRARLLAPRAEDVRSAQAALHVEAPVSGIGRAVSLVAPREWSALLLAFGWLAGMSLAFSLLRTPASRAAKRLAIGAGALFLLSVAGLTQSQLQARSLAVVKTATGVLLAPYDGAGASADLEPGMVVDAGSRYGGFVRIRGPHGTSGWVTESALEAVVGS